MKWSDSNLIPTSSKFLRLKQGENRLRIVSEVHVIGKHWEDRKLLGICIGKDEKCPHCAAGNDVKPVWLCWAIDRADEKIKQLEIGYTIIQQIQKLAKSQEYGFETFPPYDITIVKSGEGLETEYAVIASRKDTPLTEEEKAEIEELPLIADIIEKVKKKAGEPF